MRQRLLDAASTLLAEGDIEQFTVRKLTTAAGVNVAAVTTAFGGRSALLEALLHHVLVPVNEDRDRLFDALAPDAPIEDIVFAFVAPLGSLRDSESVPALRVLAAVASDTSAGNRPLDRVLRDPGVARFTKELDARSVAPPADLARRVRLAVGTILAEYALASRTSDDGDSLDQLVRFISAGLRGA